ncbi:hypothetical protein [Aquirhabdus parva]|uniref:Uncharacterized protein n=1 Tax=Aquirhabdus parva TaxID=2283318 RepID=A0A345P992_9GAMM|nr:hypothetical protein [Aquirhabdus parva]AXI03851.1 hypothetical protein HYN46_14005 [Aquirhabdus parva]
MGSNTWQPKQGQTFELTREHLNVLLPNKQTYYGGAVYPSSNTYEDEARPDTTYAQPLRKRMYLSPTPSQPKPRIVNECPTGNCVTDRLGSTFLSDVATLAPLGMVKNVARAGLAVRAPEETSFFQGPLNFTKDWKRLPASGLTFGRDAGDIIKWKTGSNQAFYQNSIMNSSRANQILNRIPASDLEHMRNYYLRFGAEEMAKKGRRDPLLAQPTPYMRAILLDRIRRGGE